MMLVRLGLALVLALAAAWLLTRRAMIDLGTIKPALRSLGIWAPIGFVVIYATGTVLFLSGALLSLAGGALFGPIWGTVWNLLGATLGATVAFLLARGIAGAWVTRRLGGRLRRLVDGVSAEGWRFVALMRLVPLVPFNLLNYALGLTSTLCPCVAHLHAARSHCLHLARLCRSLGGGGRYVGSTLRTVRSWSAHHDRLCASPVPSAPREGTCLDRVCRIAAAVGCR
jgi:hypothetical protein